MLEKTKFDTKSCKRFQHTITPPMCYSVMTTTQLFNVMTTNGLIIDTAIHSEYKEVTSGTEKFCIASPFTNISPSGTSSIATIPVRVYNNYGGLRNTFHLMTISDRIIIIVSIITVLLCGGFIFISILTTKAEGGIKMKNPCRICEFLLVNDR